MIERRRVLALLTPLAGPSDVHVGQTAAAIENLLLAAYQAIGALPFLTSFPRPVEATFIALAVQTAGHHTQHGRAFNEAVRALGGPSQPGVDAAAKTALIDPALPAVKSAIDAVRFLADVEQVAAETYAALVPVVTDKVLRATLASVTGVESQHRAALLTVAGLLEAKATALITVPSRPAALPAAAGTAGFPDSFLPVDRARPGSEGALR